MVRFNKRRRNYRRRPRGRFNRARRTYRIAKKAAVRVLNKKTETKYLDIGTENAQLWHNRGYSALAPVPGGQAALTDPSLFNFWNLITQGTGRYNRIGDVISPRGLSIRLWIANKQDRPNVIYRIMCGTFPKSYGGVVTTHNNFSALQGPTFGLNGNRLLMPPDKDRGVKFFYDRIVRVERNFASVPLGGVGGKECHVFKKMFLKRKRARNIIFDPANNEIVNRPFFFWILPYDSYGTLETDNIASYTLQARAYWKDF